jgi:hypothetical protein
MNIMSAWRKCVEDLENEGELKLEVEEDVKVGDRVEYTGGYDDGVLIVGEQGVVVIIDEPEPSIGVLWDNYDDCKTDLFGTCKDCYGYWVVKEQIRKIEDNDIDDEDKILVTDIINSITIKESCQSVNEALDELKLEAKKWENEVKTEEKECEFRIGDGVECITDDLSFVNFGERGIVVTIDEERFASIGVRLDDFNVNRHSLNGICENGHGCWIFKDFIKKIEDAKELESDIKKPVLLPKEMLKAGMVVEIANGDVGLFDGRRIVCLEGFYELDDFDDDLQEIDGDEEFLIVALYDPTYPYKLKSMDARKHKFNIVWKREGFVRKVKKEFSKDELVILNDLYDSGFLYIARDDDGELCAYKSEPIKNSCCWAGDSTYYLTYVSKLFQQVRWEDEASVEISDFI